MQKNVFECLGHRIELWTHPDPDHLSRVIRNSRTFNELDVLMKCREVYLPGTAIIDVGANIGNHAMFFGAILNAPVNAFEPYRAKYELLEMNIGANAMEGQIVATNCAIGETIGTGALQAGPPENFGTSHVTFGTGDVIVRNLDSLDIPGPIGLLKVDVEGGELPALRGAETLIQEWHPDIMVEAGTRAAFWHLADALMSYGYSPRGRFAATPTYLFSSDDQTSRMERIMKVL